MKIVPNPNPPKVNEYPNGSLSSNKIFFLNNLWRLLFEYRMERSSYNVTPTTIGVEVEKNENLSNIHESNAIDNISSLCKEEADAIATQILKYFNSAKTKLEGDISHAHGAGGQAPTAGNVSSGGTGTELGLKF
ncbi:MAG: hypothetical protein EHM58_00495 [Ignavibacteriae bacterium]|nr:MAG: hypothetical protein EHM58_00495 [Ignavibacteriota bacterium]